MRKARRVAHAVTHRLKAPGRGPRVPVVRSYPQPSPRPFPRLCQWGEVSTNISEGFGRAGVEISCGWEQLSLRGFCVPLPPQSNRPTADIFCFEEFCRPSDQVSPARRLQADEHDPVVSTGLELASIRKIESCVIRMRRPSGWAASQISASARPLRPSSPAVSMSCVRAWIAVAICRGRFSSSLNFIEFEE